MTVIALNVNGYSISEFLLPTSLFRGTYEYPERRFERIAVTRLWCLCDRVRGKTYAYLTAKCTHVS